MRIQVLHLAKQGEQSFSGMESVTLPAAFPLLTNTVNVSFSGTVTNRNRVFELHAACSAMLSASCDRCLTPVAMTVDFPLEEKYSEASETGVTDAEDEILPLPPEGIDISALLEAGLCMYFPMKIVCMEDCKGLCPICGVNANEKKCNCLKEYVNPSFEGLKALFPDEEV